MKMKMGQFKGWYPLHTLFARFAVDGNGKAGTIIAFILNPNRELWWSCMP